ncbi:MAG: hypothetical protein JSW41_02730, partial [Candidatus Aenigmatarchaeota archaeon]
RLQEGSPAIDNGTNLGFIFTDIDGTSRPQGAGYDIGAYEYQSGIPGCTINSDCDDGLFCNGAEVCQASQCVSGTNPCIGGTFCSPIVCNEQTDSCETGDTCDDGEVCTIDSCDSGSETCSHTINTGQAGCENYLFIDNFDDGEVGATGWTAYNPGGGSWSVVSNAYQLSGSVSSVDGQRVLGAYSLIDGVQADNFTFSGRLRSTSSTDWRDLALAFGYQNANEHYLVIFNNGCNPDTNGVFKVNTTGRIKIDNEGCPAGEGIGYGILNDNNYHDFKIVRNGSSIKVYFDDMVNPLFTASDNSYGSGLFGVGSVNDNGVFDDIRISGPGGAGPVCLTTADTDCNAVISLDELNVHIQAWYMCSACVPDLFQAIEAWYGI